MYFDREAPRYRLFLKGITGKKGKIDPVRLQHKILNCFREPENRKMLKLRINAINNDKLK